MLVDAKKQALLFINRQIARISPVCSDVHDLTSWKLSQKEDYGKYQQKNVHFLEQAREYEYSVIKGSRLHSGWFVVKGCCYLCRKKVRFYVDFNYGSNENSRFLPNWREHLICPSCGLSNRARAALHLFELLQRPSATANVYVTERISPLFRQLKKRYPNTVGSEYICYKTLPGQKNRRGIRHEDLTRLSFGTQDLDFILSFDVFEHIFDLEAALRECYRCLKVGGTLFFTVPFYFQRNENVVRARLEKDGKINNLLPPEFHGDPLNREGILCYHDFGWELLTKLQNQGFKDIHARIYWSRGYGYLGKDQSVFLARK